VILEKTFGKSNQMSNMLALVIQQTNHDLFGLGFGLFEFFGRLVKFFFGDR
jgi:hypothetical protein